MSDFSHSEGDSPSKQQECKCNPDVCMCAHMCGELMPWDNSFQGRPELVINTQPAFLQADTSGSTVYTSQWSWTPVAQQIPQKCTLSGDHLFSLSQFFFFFSHSPKKNYLYPSPYLKSPYFWKSPNWDGWHDLLGLFWVTIGWQTTMTLHSVGPSADLQTYPWTVQKVLIERRGHHTLGQ